jgi:hypothetical protein
MLVIHFDVLALPAEELVERLPSSEGRKLWNVLFDKYMGRIVVIIDAETDLHFAQEWLKRERFKASVIHQALDMYEDRATARSEAAWLVAAQLGRMDWYLDTDPATCAAMLAKGVPTLLVAVPSVMRPEWRSPRSVRGWDAITSEIDEQALRRAEKTWGDDV